MSILALLFSALFGFLFAMSPPTASSDSAYDEEVKADIDAIHAQLESYYSRNGDYPTENELYLDYDSILAGLDVKHLTDPNGRIIGNASAYQYVPSGCSALGCTGYTLSATLDNTSVYSKESLN